MVVPKVIVSVTRVMLLTLDKHTVVHLHLVHMVVMVQQTKETLVTVYMLLVAVEV